MIARLDPGLHISLPSSLIMLYVFYTTQYRVFAESLINAAERNVAGVFGQLQGQARSTTSYAQATNQLWPFVTIDDFEYRAADVSGLASADMIIFAPIVPAEQKEAWEMYSASKQDWTITVSLRCQRSCLSI